MRARLEARRGVELRPHHLRHQPETRQRVARSQLIAAVFTKKKGCRGDDSPGKRCHRRGPGTGDDSTVITPTALTRSVSR